MTDKLLPRHRLIIDYLTSQAPKRLTVDEIAKHCKIAKSTVRNEMLIVLQLSPKVQRSVRAKERGRGTYQYYVGAPETSDLPKGFEDWAKPISTVNEVGQIFSVTTAEGYVSAPARLGWKLPLALCQLVDAALSDDLSKLGEARQAVEELSDAATAYAVVLSRVLATTELWDDPRWLTAGMPEENLEKLGETTRQALARYAKLDPSKQEPKETD
jgi:hypothetical protein